MFVDGVADAVACCLLAYHVQNGTKSGRLGIGDFRS